MLAGLDDSTSSDTDAYIHTSGDTSYVGGSIFPSNSLKIGIGLDSCVIPLRHTGLWLVQTTDFFYPLIDDPYIMGRITCANVLSDIYAMGVCHCDNMLMLLGVSNQMTEKERGVVMPLIVQGFQDTCKEADTAVNGGQTVVNPWLTLGGVATAVCHAHEIIQPMNAIDGDVLVLTKPLGTQIVANLYQWMCDKSDKWNRAKIVCSEEELSQAYSYAKHSMARLNRTAALLMHVHHANACTDVTGFGLLGHASNLARVQKHPVSFYIHNLPIIAKMSAVAKTFPNFGLLQGTSAETSGGLLVCLSRENATAFCKEIERIEGHQAWIVGIVVAGTRTAHIIDKPRVIEVTSSIA